MQLCASHLRTPIHVIIPAMRRARTVRTQAVVLRQRDFGEADRVLTLLTPEHGKLHAIARGIRRPTSRKAGHLDLYMLADVLVAKGRDLDIVTQAATVDAFRPLRENLLRSSYASYCVELLDSFTPDGETNQPLFRLLVNALAHIGAAGNLPLVARYFEIHLLGLVGFQPQLHRCVIRGELIQAEDQFFDAGAGGVVCPQCGNAGVGRPITMAALKMLRLLQRSEWKEIANLQLRATVESELEQVLHNYIAATLERQPRSVDFLNRVRRAIRANSN